MSATLAPQVGTQSTGQTETARALPFVQPLPHNLSFTRYAHGEMRLSIYPVQVPTWKGVRTCGEVAYQTAMHLDDAEVNRRRLDKKVASAALVQCEKFQDDIQEVAGYGGLPHQKIFGRNARIAIDEAGEIAWRKFKRSGLFCTATVPGSGALIAYIIACYSGWLLNRVKQWYRDKFTQDNSVFAVWEHQERGMLHLHLCVCSLERDKLQELKDAWKEKWNKLLLELSEKVDVDLFRKNDKWSWREDLAKTKHEADWLEKNPAHYLAKYMGKGEREEASASPFHPSKWWSVDRKTAREAREERVRVVLGGLPLGELKGFVERFFEGFGEDLEEFIPKMYPFKNPQWSGCGGVLCFAEAEQSLDIAWWFEAVAAEFASAQEDGLRAA